MSTEFDMVRLNHELSLLHTDLATSSPKNYTLEEKRAICEDIDATGIAIDDAIRTDFYFISTEARAKMLHVLKTAEGFEENFWEKLLL